MLNIRSEEVVIWLLVPLKKKKINTIKYRASHCEKETGQHLGWGEVEATSRLREQDGEVMTVTSSGAASLDKETRTKRNRVLALEDGCFVL